MRKKLCMALLAGLAISSAYAQDPVVSSLRKETTKEIKKEADTIKYLWKRGGLINANFSQGSLSNWAAGGDNFSMSITSYFNYFLYYQKDRHSWDNNLDVNLGFVQTTSGGGRKNDDRFDFLSKYGYKLDSSKWYLSGLFNFRSQFFDGYTYSSGNPDFASTFLAPAYLTMAVGFDYKPNPDLSIFTSPITSRTVFVLNGYLSNKGAYGVDTGRNVKFELGAYMSVNYKKNIATGIVYKSRLDMFSNYLKDPQNINFYMTNLLAFKINRYFSATYSLDLIYDDNVRQFGPNGTSPALQAKSIIGIGFLKPLTPVRRLTKPINT